MKQKPFGGGLRCGEAEACRIGAQSFDGIALRGAEACRIDAQSFGWITLRRSEDVSHDPPPCFRRKMK